MIMDYSQIVITNKAYRALKHLYKVNTDFIDRKAASELRRHKLVDAVHERQPDGGKRYEGKCSITDDGAKYFVYAKQFKTDRFFERRLPVVVSLLSMLLSAVAVLASLTSLWLQLR